MFCTRLRNRPEWAAVIPTLLSSQSPKWHEKKLDTHDIAIELPRLTIHKEVLRLLLLSATDMKSADSMSRIERLYSLDGNSRRVAVVFLLHEKDANSKIDGKGMTAYMELQVKLLTLHLHLQILPLSNIASLTSTLWSFSRQLMKPYLAPPIIDSVSTILPYCTTGCGQQQQLPEHARNVLSDIVHSFPELAVAATTPDGQANLRHWLSNGSGNNGNGGNSGGSRIAEGVIEFWQVEYMAQ